jgi:N-sulfoglucosamine sulfohydrolase
MVALAPQNPALAARLDLFDHRVPEELYHYTSDPDALTNLIASPAHRAERDRLIAQLEAWMVRTRDPMLPVFRQRSDATVREAYQKSVEQEAASRNATKTKKGKAGKRKAGKKSGD